MDAEEEPGELEMLDPDNLRRYIESQVQQGIQSAVEQHPLIQQQYQQQGRQIAEQQLSAWEGQVGKFDHGMAISAGQAALSMNPNLTPMQALQIGAAQARQYEEQIRQSAIAEYEEQLRNRLGASSGDAPARGSASESPPQQTDYDKVLENWAARRGAGTRL
jgi:hypothetical protein